MEPPTAEDLLRRLHQIEAEQRERQEESIARSRESFFMAMARLVAHYLDDQWGTKAYLSAASVLLAALRLAESQTQADYGFVLEGVALRRIELGDDGVYRILKEIMEE